MPEQLKVHSGERVDLVDYVHGSNTYTQETQKFLLEREWLDRRSRILDGFRIQVEDQIANPGMITVYNGNAVDRSGQIINNETTANDSRSITLLGASLNFYVEIEFIQNESNTDARYFWDPTIPNPPPEPSGSEFSLNVATRLTPDWRIVSPVSTTSFQQTATPGSIRVPVGVFRTDGSNRITTGGTNPGLTLVRAASVLEADVAASATSIRVVDARVFPATVPFDVTVDFGAGTPENRTVSTVDRDNGILGLSVALGSSHQAGAIVRVTSGNAELVRESVDPNEFNPLASPPGHPDPAQRLWQANEVRGSALIQSKETFGVRDDLNIRSLKDQVDYLSAQIRELKFGSPRPEVVSAAPPATFSARPRWFDRAGSITGARSNTVSIGNGTTTFGDFNGTTSAVLSAAIAALPSGGGTIYVKSGTYNFASTVVNSKALIVIGDSAGNTIFNNTNVAGPIIATSAAVSFKNISLQFTGGAAANVIDIAASIPINFDYCIVTGQIRIGNFAGRIVAENSTFLGSGGNPIVNALSAASTLNVSTFTSCTIISSSGPFISCPVNRVKIQQCYLSVTEVLTLPAGACNVESFTVFNCTCDVNKAVVLNNTTTGYVDGLSFINCRFSIVTLNSNEAVFYLANTGTVDNVKIKDNYCSILGGVQTAVSPAYFVYLENNASSHDFQVDSNSLEAPIGSFIVGVKLDQDSFTGVCTVNDNFFFRCSRGVIVGGPVGLLNSGELSIVGNVHDNASEHASVYGVVIANNGRLDRLNIQKNTFLNYDNGSFVGARVCLDLSTNSASLTHSINVITGNKFINIGSSTATITYGVLYSVNTASAMRHRFDINENFFSSFSSSADCAAISVSNTGGAISSSASVRNNKVYDIGSATTGNAFGIYLLGFSDNLQSSASVSENFVSGIRSAIGASVGSGIETVNCVNTRIVNNYVADIRSLYTIGTYATQLGCGIRVSGTCSKLSVIGNTIDQSISAAPIESSCCIVLISSSVIDNFLIEDNIINSGTIGLQGGGLIWLVRNDGGAGPPGIVGFDYRNGNISKNVLNFNVTSGQATYVINCEFQGVNSNSISVVNNIIRQTTYSANSEYYIGVRIRGWGNGGNTANVKINDNVFSAPKSGALTAAGIRAGILMTGPVDRTMISNNVIDWNEIGVLRGRGIYYQDDLISATLAQVHVCNGNIVRPTDGAEIYADTTQFVIGYIVGNLVGQGSGALATGTISAGGSAAAASAAGWDFGLGTSTTISVDAFGSGSYFGVNKLS